MTDPPPAEALLLTDEFVKAQIEEHLVDEKYNTILLLDVENLDKKGLEEAEERRREKEPVRPNLPEKKTKTKGSEFFWASFHLLLSCNMCQMYRRELMCIILILRICCNFCISRGYH